MRTGSRLLLIMLSLWGAAPAFAQGEATAPVVDKPPYVDVTSAHLVIDIKPEYIARQARKLSWEKACNVLGKALVEDGDGPWGLGPFSDYRCSEAAPEYGRGAGESLWRLSVSPVGKKGQMAFRLEPVGTIGIAGKSNVASTMRLGEALEPLDLLANPELARRIAATLTDGLPMIARIRAQKDGATLKLKYPAQVSPDQDDAIVVPSPPKKLNFYELRWDDAAKLWRPRIIGTGKLGKVVRPKDEEGAHGAVRYTLDEAVAKALAAGPLWVHDSRGAGAGTKAWTSATKELHEEIAEEQEDRMSSPLVASAADLLGFVGIRYGTQILTGNKLLEQTKFFGLLLEVRAGPLSGLQYYYDVLPETKFQETSVTDVAVDSEISWSRHVLGYTFRFPFPWLIDRITLTPKLGVWSLKAKIPGEADELGRVDELRQFEIGNALSAGVELGVEYLASRFAIRPWGGVDSSYSILGEESSVTSRRVGIDLYVGGPSFEMFSAPVRFALLGFVFIENVALTSGAPELQETDVGDDGVRRTVARKIEYNAGYAGLGLALSW